MQFTQLEILELKKIVASSGVPISFRANGESIDLYFERNNSIHALLKKAENYSIEAMNSDGTIFNPTPNKFDVIKVHTRKWINAIKRDNPFELERISNIESLSPNFYQVFQEAHIIESLEFHESAGMIYRKALELVVKDFLIFLLPDFQEIVLQNTINRIIFHFYRIENNELQIIEKANFENVREELATIKLLAKKIKNTFNIGNDFAHYERKLTSFTAKDMKLNILKIIEFISTLLKEKHLQKQRKELDSEFENETFL